MTDTTTPGEANQTVLGLYVTAREAFEIWKAKPEAVVIVDVRTPAEVLVAGHPPMAWNIPVATQSSGWDPCLGQLRMKLLPDFVARVSRVAKLHDTILVICRSGDRSALAANLLAKAGFTAVYNIIDGMEGDGQRLRGWRHSGAPQAYDLARERTLLSGVR